MAKLIDCFNGMMNVVLEEEEKQKQIVAQVQNVEFPYSLILDKVYIQGKRLVKVADEMNYNYDHMKKMHKIALKKFDNVPPNATE